MGSIPSRDGNRVVMEFRNNAAVAAFGAIEPLGDTCDGGRAKACLLFNYGVGHFSRKHFGGLEPFGEFLYLVGRYQIAQKTPRLVRRFQRQKSPYQLLIFGRIPVHTATLLQWSALVKWSAWACG